MNLLEMLGLSSSAELRAIRGGRVCGRALARDINKVAEFCRDHSKADLYFGAAPRSSLGGLDSCLPLTCLWADIDFKTTPEPEARELLALCDWKPHAVVRSGGGLHVYWLLAEPLDPREAKPWLREFAKRVGGDMSSAEPARILRIPGTRNFKYDPPRDVETESMDPGAPRISLETSALAGHGDASDMNWEGGPAAAAAARAWLEDQEPAVKGNRDNRAYQIACRLARDYGLGESDALALLIEWNDKCSPPLSAAEVRAKIQSARKYGTGSIGSADPAADFADAAADSVDAESGLMARMSERFRAVDEDGRLVIYSQRRDDTLGRTYWVRYDRRGFIEVCRSVLHLPMVAAGKTKRGEDKMVEAGAAWLDNYRKKTTYQGIVFAPEHEGDKTPDGKLNLWRGFSVEPRRGHWDYLKELLWETLCDEDDECHEYCMNWMARLAQRPWEPGGVALVFKGPKGTGKGTLGRALVKLLGRHGMHITSPALLTGRFNAHLRDCAMLFADEAHWAGDKAGEGVLKGLVTEPAIAYEGKGRDAEMGRNCVHLVMASNDSWVVPAGLDGERRWAIMQTKSDEHKSSFWEKLIDEMNNQGGLEAMLWELRHRDISGFNVFKFPQTEALMEQKIRSMKPHEAWLYDILDSGEYFALPGERAPRSERKLVFMADMQASLREFYRNHNRFREGLETLGAHLGMMIKKMLPSTRIRRVRRPADRAELPERPWAYELPGEALARKEFAKTLGRDPWENEKDQTSDISRTS